MKNKKGLTLNLIAIIYISISSILMTISNEISVIFTIESMAIFVTTAILGMFSSVKNIKAIEYIVLILSIICIVINIVGLFMFDFAIMVFIQVCTLIPSILLVKAAKDNL